VGNVWRTRPPGTCTVSDLGPLLLSRILKLNDTRSGVLREVSQSGL
jgi:hypothetical protein